MQIIGADGCYPREARVASANSGELKMLWRVSEATIEQFEYLDVVLGGAMSASAATMSVGTWTLRTSLLKSKSFDIASPILVSS
jgi:hypothetical protein